MPQVGVPAAMEREKLIDEDAGAKPGFNSAVNDLYSHVVPVKRRRWREMEWYEAALLIVQVCVVCAVSLSLSIPLSLSLSFSFPLPLHLPLRLFRSLAHLFL